MFLTTMPKVLAFIGQTKGYFPHQFSLVRKINHIEDYLPQCDYGVGGMSTDEQNNETS